jgi:hypothetical protein
MARSWTAVLARLGLPTGDGRLLAPGGITNRDLPLPLMWQDRTTDGHGGSYTVGRIEQIEYHPDMVTASGTLLDTPEADQAFAMIEAGVTGPSVDLDDLDYQMDDGDLIVITAGRIAGATLVPIPAFAEVSIAMSAQTSVLAAVRTSGWSDMPISDATSWDGDAAANRVAAWAGVDGEDGDWGKYARAFLLKRDDADPETKGAYGFGIADVEDGRLVINPAGVSAAAAAVQGARGGANISDEEASSIRSVLSGIYARMDKTAPWDEEEASLAASAAFARKPPLAWFANPMLTGPTPLTITDEGRVFGHCATWGVCHVGLPGCVTAPYSQTEYAYFLTGAEETSDGVTVPVGKLTVGGGHADPEAGFVAAAEHYDNVGTAVASVNAGEDEYGIWVAGYVLPGATEKQVDELRRSPLSGDWRNIGGNLELIAAHAVNVPGFPVPRARVKFSLGRQRSLIGHFKVEAKAPEVAELPVDRSSEARARFAWSQRKGR